MLSCRHEEWVTATRSAATSENRGTSAAQTAQSCALWHHNRRVIRSLPSQDDWPFLTRHMFSASPMFGSRCDAARTTATYRGPVVYFGGSFSSIYTQWQEWLEKFEALLRRMYWEHAVVILVTEWMGQHVYRWDAEDAASPRRSLSPSVIGSSAAARAIFAAHNERLLRPGRRFRRPTLVPVCVTTSAAFHCAPIVCGRPARRE